MFDNGKKQCISMNGPAGKQGDAEPKLRMSDRLTSPLLEKILSSRQEMMRMQADQRFCKCRS